MAAASSPRVRRVKPRGWSTRAKVAGRGRPAASRGACDPPTVRLVPRAHEGRQPLPSLWPRARRATRRRPRLSLACARAADSDRPSALVNASLRRPRLSVRCARRTRQKRERLPISVGHVSSRPHPKRPAELPLYKNMYSRTTLILWQRFLLSPTVMGSSSPIPPLFLLLLSSSLLFPSTSAADPDPVQDFCVAVNSGSGCKPAASTTSDDFFSAVLSGEHAMQNPKLGFNVSTGDVLSFPGLNTLGVSMNRADLAAGGTIPPHTHPRATELVLITKGEVLVGFVSTDGRLFSKVVRSGELFVLPRGLMHFLHNVGKGEATAFVAFNSQLPGTVLAPQTLFGARPAIPDQVLAMSFQVEEKVVKEIKSNFG
ncbi:Germin-like protein 3-7 [Apostasia shenzhenica]|uniref:Germin-like protein 3-7 n=1 Tax=Apostasia shenzhenica TaxID=1088818 RepID=A0A2I0B1Z5_9ASPA|nr:Germin-like protein 3-7 [Apostasia shenzhenica]